MNTFGNNFRVSIFGESHGECIGAVIDGMPAGIRLSVEDFTADIDRRRSGAKGTTPRHEADIPQIVSGLYEGHTTGAPLTILFRNENTRSEDYKAISGIPRPGHADYPAAVKWESFNDPRGGGHFSGRLTLPLVAAGVVAKRVLGVSSQPFTFFSNAPSGEMDCPQTGIETHITIHARLSEVGGIPIESDANDNSGAAGELKLPPAVEQRIEWAKKSGDSLGGIVECTVTNVSVGTGDPFFNSIESIISHAVFSIPGVRGIEFGDGFAATRMTGSEHNDPLGTTTFPPGNPSAIKIMHEGSDYYSFVPCPLKNGAGGINGGLANGAPIVFRVAFKPTSSIARAQRTLNLRTGWMDTLRIRGRHDVCFALRTPVIVEAVTAIVLADLLASR